MLSDSAQSGPAGRRLCLVTAGPTREFLDPVRFLSNPSSGRMGFALAAAAVEAGWPVCLVAGPTSLEPPEGLKEYVPVVSAADMFREVAARFASTKLLIMSAAVGDMRPKHPRPEKVRKADLDWTVEFEPTEDILLEMGRRKQSGQWLAGFAAETGDFDAGALPKLKAKNLDWIAANSVADTATGFAAEQNRIVLFDRWGGREDLGLHPKAELARQLLRRFSRRA